MHNNLYIHSYSYTKIINHKGSYVISGQLSGYLLCRITAVLLDESKNIYPMNKFVDTKFVYFKITLNKVKRTSFHRVIQFSLNFNFLMKGQLVLVFKYLSNNGNKVNLLRWLAANDCQYSLHVQSPDRN